MSKEVKVGQKAVFDLHIHPPGNKRDPRKLVRTLADAGYTGFATVMATKDGPHIEGVFNEESDRLGLMHLNGIEIPTKEGHMLFVFVAGDPVSLDKAARLNRELYYRAANDHNPIPALEATKRLRGELDATSSGVHYRCGRFAPRAYGIEPDVFEKYVHEVRDSGDTKAIGGEKYDSEASRAEGPPNHRRVEIIDKMLTRLKPLGVGELGGTDDRGRTLLWSHTEMDVIAPFYDSQGFKLNLDSQLLLGRTRAVENQSVKNLLAWFHGLLMIYGDHKTPRWDKKIVDDWHIPRSLAEVLGPTRLWNLATFQLNRSNLAWGLEHADSIKRGVTYDQIHYQQHPLFRPTMEDLLKMPTEVIAAISQTSTPALTR